MIAHYNGIQLRFTHLLNRDKVIKTDSDQAIMNPYNGAVFILESNYAYSDVFGVLGVTTDSVDACIDHALKVINEKLEKR